MHRSISAICPSYDTAHPGDVTALTDANGHASRHAYDAYGDLIRASDPLGATTRDSCAPAAGIPSTAASTPTATTRSTS